MHCNSLSLCETLGHVSYILTDKTGTLTTNELVLRELNVEDEMLLLGRGVSRSLEIPDHSEDVYDYQEPRVQWSDTRPTHVVVSAWSHD